MKRISLFSSVALIASLFYFGMFLSATQLYATHGNSTADDYCSPQTCLGTSAYLKVNACKCEGIGCNEGPGGTSTKYCANDGTTPNYPLTCGGNDCSGWATGVDGCQDKTPVYVGGTWTCGLPSSGTRHCCGGSAASPTPTPVPTSSPGGCVPGGCDTTGCNDVCQGSACGWNGCSTCSTGTKVCGAIPPTCTISGLTSVVAGDTKTYSATCSGDGLYKSELYRSITTSQSWEIPAFATSVTGTVSGNKTFAWGEGGNSYYLTVNGYGSAGQCSGNPWCWGQAFPASSCSPPWTDCGANDLLTVTTLPGGPTVSATCGAGGTTATFTWNSPPGAGSYILRVNKEPYYNADWSPPSGGDSWIGPATTGQVVAITPATNHSFSVQSVAGGNVFDASKRGGYSCGDVFNTGAQGPFPPGCPVINCPAPVPSPSVAPSPSPSPSPSPPAPPVAPILGTTSSCGPNQVTLSWVPGSGVNLRYDIYRCTGAICTPTFYIADPDNASTYVDTNVTNLTTYRYLVRAIDTLTGLFTNSNLVTTTLSCVGELQARAVLIDDTDTSCTAIENALAQALYPTNHSVSGLIPNPNLQTGSSYVSWTNVPTGIIYTLSTTPTTGYVLQRYCQASTALGQDTDEGAAMDHTLGSGETVTWNVGYTLPQAWFGARGGNVHTNRTYSIELPVLANFITTETQQKSGLASYDSSGGAPYFGQGQVSSDGYLVAETTTYTYPSSYYTYYYGRFGPKDEIPGCISASCTISSMPTDATPVDSVELFSRAGSLQIDPTSTWNVTTGVKKVIFVNGTLTINLSQNQKITVQDGGFLAFIVSGGIVVNNTVGRSAPFTTTPDRVNDAHISGVFIIDGSFTTNASPTPPDLQLILAGTYVARNFGLNRNLDVSNATYPGELFVYRPDLWTNAPEALKQIEIKWQEVAP